MYFKLLRSSWDDFALCAGVLAGFFLVAHIVTAVVLAFFSDGTSLMISGMILPIVSAFLILIYSLSYSGFQFSHLVRLGCTRRRSLALTLGAAAAVALFCMLLSALLAWLELSLAPSLWQAITGCDGVYYGSDGWVALDNISPNALFVELFVMGLVCHSSGRYGHGSAVRHHSPPLRQKGHVGAVGAVDVGVLCPSDCESLPGADA